jgi:hypothetical protein
VSQPLQLWGRTKKPPQRTLVEDDGGSGQDATVPLNIVTYTHRPKRSPRKRKAAALEAAIITPRKRAGGPAKSVRHPHRSPEQPANPTYWLSTNAELKGPTITLHVEGCPILRRSRWRALRVLTGPLTWAQIAVLPDHGYQACGRCNPAAPA